MPQHVSPINYAKMESKESKQLGTLLAMYVLTSEDDLAKAFRAEYRRLTSGDKPESALPPKNNYVALWRYIQSQAQRGVDWRLRANGNRSEMARQLSKVVGWVVDENALRKAEKRLFRTHS